MNSALLNLSNTAFVGPGFGEPSGETSSHLRFLSPAWEAPATTKKIITNGVIELNVNKAISDQLGTRSLFQEDLKGRAEKEENNYLKKRAKDRKFIKLGREYWVTAILNIFNIANIQYSKCFSNCVIEFRYHSEVKPPSGSSLRSVCDLQKLSGE